ncbi:Cytochrome c class III [Desulfosarcina cetonica]|uniref:cytochrome c3 family protein n=1 Tax=Desulfosarcina cetonica TaxID=90730 RepID=UPI0006D0C0B1|nr:cytochrome c3 family protein [Desulfosarcina cetonica]VTR64531.1 Cytochrome c class III [Desulfosarcina cetonica]
MAVLNKQPRSAITALALTLLVLTVLGGFSVSHGQEAEIVLDNANAYGRGQRPVVRFSHELHMDMFDCLDCHHDYDNQENVLDEEDLEAGNPAVRCTSCHDSDSTPDLERAYHVQCMGCHRQARINGEDTGPELCGECHIK